MTNEQKLESARQELRKLPEQWRNLYANHQALLGIRDARVQTYLISEALGRPGDPLNPSQGEFGPRMVAAIENQMMGRAAIPHTLVQIVENLPEFSEAVEAVAKVVDKVRKLEAAAAADREALAKAEADLAAAEAEFILEAKERFEASKRETIEADPRFKALRDAAEAARAKLAG
jgi:hypothetical protein